ncbi:peroxisomal membrane protein 11C-like [Ornithodoros turicata]
MYSLDDVLQSYRGRDGIFRAVGYACLLAGGLTSGNASKKFYTVSSEISQCRVVMRFLDDWPMLKYSMEYGVGKSEQDDVLRAVGILKNAADQLFYPTEHIAWLAKKKIIDVSSNIWETSGTILWTISLYCSIARSLRLINMLQKKKEKYFLQTVNPTGDDYSLLVREQTQNLLCFLRCLLDLINAISWLPSGFLWSGKLKAWHNGLLGLVSSFLSFAQETIR